MLIGYARVSKADGSQSLALQRDALRAGGAHAKELSDGVGPQTITTGQHRWNQDVAVPPVCLSLTRVSVMHPHPLAGPPPP